MDTAHPDSTLDQIMAAEAELREIYDGYEDALVNNHADKLIEYFWKSPKTVRYGATENLYGSEEIDAFRRARPSAGLARTVTRLEVAALDGVTGSVNLEFARDMPDGPRLGRQSQFWRKFPDVGWKVVSAHVSLLPPGARA
mmetsp:Transcript_87198/g.151698  ORF Transcript_87198/g.151698 Transcript_87198/m.151698 type:complete len:141 (-) Transcript_87198:185-607(-)